MYSYYSLAGWEWGGRVVVRQQHDVSSFEAFRAVKRRKGRKHPYTWLTMQTTTTVQNTGEKSLINTFLAQTVGLTRPDGGQVSSLTGVTRVVYMFGGYLQQTGRILVSASRVRHEIVWRCRNTWVSGVAVFTGISRWYPLPATSLAGVRRCRPASLL